MPLRKFDTDLGVRTELTMPNVGSPLYSNVLEAAGDSDIAILEVTSCSMHPEQVADTYDFFKSVRHVIQFKKALTVLKFEIAADVCVPVTKLFRSVDFARTMITLISIRVRFATEACDPFYEYAFAQACESPRIRNIVINFPSSLQTLRFLHGVIKKSATLCEVTFQDPVVRHNFTEHLKHHELHMLIRDHLDKNRLKAGCFEWRGQTALALLQRAPSRQILSARDQTALDVVHLVPYNVPFHGWELPSEIAQFKNLRSLRITNCHIMM